MTKERIRETIGADAAEVLDIVQDLDEAGLAQVLYFSAGVKARADYERRKAAETEAAS